MIMSNGFFVDQDGKYQRECAISDGIAAGFIQVPTAPESSLQIWDFESESWGRVPVQVPESVTMRQARLALLGAGYLDAVEEALSNMEGPEGQAARIEWQYSSQVFRNKPFVIILGTQLGMTSEQMDQLFISASQID